MLKSYYLPNDRKACEGYAYIVIDTETGFFSTVSDYGNYAYLWSDPGCEFRKFLARLDAHYLHGKLMMGRDDRLEFDEDLARRAAWRCLLGYVRDKREESRRRPDRFAENERLIDDEKDLYGRASFSSREEIYEWGMASRMPGIYELDSYFVTNRQCMAFCERVWPRFSALLLNELDDERRAAEASPSP